MTMTSTVLQRPATTTTTTTTADKKATKATTATAARNRNTMAWSHEKLRFSCIDNIGLKQLWKLIALDTASSNSNSHNNNNNSNSNVEQPKVNNNNNEVSNLAKKKATRKTKTQAAVTSMQSHPRRKQTQQQRKWPKHTPTIRAQAPLYRVVAPAHDSLPPHQSGIISEIILYDMFCLIVETTVGIFCLPQAQAMRHVNRAATEIPVTHVMPICICIIHMYICMCVHVYARPGAN